MHPIHALLFLVGALQISQQSQPEWTKLFDAHKIAEAETLCTGMTKAADVATRVEGQKCLANVALSKGSIITLQGDNLGGGTMGEGYTPEATDDALKHLNEGLRLAPQDLSLHQGRLHVLEVTGRFDAMIKALDESASVYQGPEALKDWLAYDAELANAGQINAGIQFAEVLDRHYPNSHDVIGNIGAFHNMLKEWDKGVPYIKQAVALAPNDPIDTWNLGWAYDHLGQLAEADKWMSKSIELDPAGSDMPEAKCLYAEFVEIKLHDTLRACNLEKQSCDVEKQTACKQSTMEPR